MASGSNQQEELPLAGKWTDENLKGYAPNQVPEPVTRLKSLWETQVIFPYSLNGTTHAFGGPKPDDNNRNKKTMSFFPLYQSSSPRAFLKEPYNFTYIKPTNKVFRSAPSHKDKYIAWLDRVQHDFEGIWQTAGIFDLIQLSRTGLKYDQEMIIVALHFFETSTNTFHFECGMMTPTLFDVAAITGLSPLGDTYDPYKSTRNIEVVMRDKTYTKYIAEQHKDTEEVSDEEHVAFLALWLSQYVFCTRSLQVAKMFVPMATQLHECHQFGFGRLLLGCLYEAMRIVCGNIKKAGDGSTFLGDGSTFLGSGPFWLLQLWLNATFSKELEIFLREQYYPESAERQIEGIRLARMIPRPRGKLVQHGLFIHFLHYQNMKKNKMPFGQHI
ncbi:hypothetical protein A2U01_0002644 [Trifolium medium]|uniref:Aminotransferase-like plant mobile domain-containing protein n=1 Tax=Trifolium medium TaxID=97028 RepID=A0A392M3J6_9FABA|nr:hypothetical protein [Trifolium medium]